VGNRTVGCRGKLDLEKEHTVSLDKTQSFTASLDELDLLRYFFGEPEDFPSTRHSHIVGNRHSQAVATWGFFILRRQK
jgi:hypothetical protein